MLSVFELLVVSLKVEMGLFLLHMYSATQLSWHALVSAIVAWVCSEDSETHPLDAVLKQAALACDDALDEELTDVSRMQHIMDVCTHVRLQCEERFLVYPYQALPTHWRQRHTDAILLACVTSLLVPQGTPTTYLERIHDLDLALFVSATPAPEQRTLVHAALPVLQARYRDATMADSHGTMPPIKRARQKRFDYMPSPVTRAPLCSAASPIESFTTPLTFTQFLAHCPSPTLPHGRPFIVRGLASSWPAITKWNDRTYLLDQAGPGRAVPVETGGAYTSNEWGQSIMPWATFLADIGWGEEPRATAPPTSKRLYLAQHMLWTQFPWLADDIVTPDYVHMAPDTLDEPLQHAWIGPAGTVSPAHTDPYKNCYVQVVGSKRVWIAPPDANQNGAMDVFEADDEDVFTHLMDNTSRVDVFDVHLPAPFRDQVVPRAQWADLGPGDMLFLPPKWWHALQSTTQVRCYLLTLPELLGIVLVLIVLIQVHSVCHRSL